MRISINSICESAYDRFVSMGEIFEVIPKIVKDTAESVIEEIEEFSPTVLVKKDASIWLSYKKTIDENYKITLVINGKYIEIRFLINNVIIKHALYKRKDWDDAVDITLKYLKDK